MENKISPTRKKLKIQNNFTRRNYLDDIFNNFVNDIIDFSYPLTFNNDGQRALLPKIDVFENDTEYCVQVELPGILQENIDLTVNNNVLTVEAKRENLNQKNKNYHMQEIYYGFFSRSINLPTNIKESAIDASFNHGVLTIVIPKKEQTETKKIKIK